MLILTRRVGERLIIGDDIMVSIEQVHGLQVRIGIAAPKQVAVHRQEIFERIRAESRAPDTSQRGSRAAVSSVRHRRFSNEQ